MSEKYLKTSVGNLAIVNRDIRVMGTLQRFAFLSGAHNRARVFANTIVQRYDRRLRRWQRLERVFRLLRFVRNTFNTPRHLLLGDNRYLTARLNIRPALVLKQMSRTETSPEYRTNMRVQNIKNAVQLNDRVHHLAASLERKTSLQVTYAERLIQGVVKGTIAERLVQRIVKRSTRIEENVFHRKAQRTLGSTRAEYLKPASPVPRTDPGSAAEMSSDPSLPRQKINDFPGASNRSTMRRNNDDDERIAAVNVDQLTDQVVRAIDQQIIAQRERLGRI